MNFTYSRNNKSLNRITRTAAVMLLSFIISSLYAQDSTAVFELSASKYLMGTEFEITAYHTSIDSCKKAMYYALKEVERIESVTSNYRDSTEITNVNNHAFDNPVKISDELFGLLRRSIKYSDYFAGVFDMTVGPLTDYWGFNSDHPLETEPDSARIKSLLEFVNYKYVVLDSSNSTVRFLKKGVKIDLGGIAKGYALDRAVEVMKKKGVNNFLISGGGDIYVSGRKPGNAKWVVGIKDPRDEKNLIAELEAENTGVITSGDYERFRIINGKRYHHIFNPKNGFPASLSQSATVITDECERGVVLSKILFILGAETNNYFEAYPFYRVTGNGAVIYNMLLKPYLLMSK
ncbi:MAG: FAD:protein FMN transferase [Bacteroidetes bacterium]|nr:FAD:protein FMN transferase [Bacteroidota bacterium]